MTSKCFLVLAGPVVDAGACGGVSHHTNFGKVPAQLIVTSFENASENQLRPVCWPIEVRWLSVGALSLRARSIDGSPPRVSCSRSMILPSGLLLVYTWPKAIVGRDSRASRSKQLAFSLPVLARQRLKLTLGSLQINRRIHWLSILAPRGHLRVLDFMWSQRLPRFVASCGNSCRYESWCNYGFFRKESLPREQPRSNEKSATFWRRSFR